MENSIKAFFAVLCFAVAGNVLAMEPRRGKAGREADRPYARRSSRAQSDRIAQMIAAQGNADGLIEIEPGLDPQVAQAFDAANQIILMMHVTLENNAFAAQAVDLSETQPEDSKTE
jgi:hypothetical protein